MNRRKSLEQRLSENTVQVLPSGCVVWTGYTDKDGYAITCMTGPDGKKNRKVHRLVLEQRIGRKLPEGALACHRCDVRCCVNEDHLFAGTHADNVLDMISKGRCDPGSRDNRGVKNPNRKLSPSDIAFIRAHHTKGDRTSPFSTAALARRFDVHRTQIQRISRGAQWAGVADVR